MMSFTGAELAALVQERSLICASPIFSDYLRAELHSSAHRRSINNFVHWCRGVYFIYYAGPRQLMLDVREESDRTALFAALGSTGVLTIDGHQYRIAHEPLNACYQSSSDFGRLDSAQTGPARRGAEWVRAALSGRSRQSQFPVEELVTSISRMALPLQLALERDPADAADADEARDDTIRAFNMSNRIREADLSTEARAVLRTARRATLIPRGQLVNVAIKHHLGGPCSMSQCSVLMPLGGEDGAALPLPQGFRAFPSLNVALGSDITAAFRALASVRGSPAEPPAKRQRVNQFDKQQFAGASEPKHNGCLNNIGESASISKTTDHQDAQPVASEPRQELREDGDGANVTAAEDDRDSEFGYKPPDSDEESEVNAGELAGSSPKNSDSSGSDNNGPRLGAEDMIIDIAAGHLARSQRGAGADEIALREATAPRQRPLLVFWGEARWQRTQLLGELARGDWGLCQASSEDMLRQDELWNRIAVEERRPVHAPPSEMSREGEALQRRALARLVAAHLEARRQQDAPQPQQE